MDEIVKSLIQTIGGGVVGGLIGYYVRVFAERTKIKSTEKHEVGRLQESLCIELASNYYQLVMFDETINSPLRGKGYKFGNIKLPGLKIERHVLMYARSRPTILDQIEDSFWITKMYEELDRIEEAIRRFKQTEDSFDYVLEILRGAKGTIESTDWPSSRSRELLIQKVTPRLKKNFETL